MNSFMVGPMLSYRKLHPYSHNQKFGGGPEVGIRRHPTSRAIYDNELIMEIIIKIVYKILGHYRTYRCRFYTPQIKQKLITSEKTC